MTNDAPAQASVAREAAYKAAWEAGRLSDLGWEMANQNATPLSLLADFIASCKAMVDAVLDAPPPTVGEDDEAVSWQWRWQFNATGQWSRWEDGQPTDYVLSTGFPVERRALYTRPAPAADGHTDELIGQIGRLLRVADDHGFGDAARACLATDKEGA